MVNDPRFEDSPQLLMAGGRGEEVVVLVTSRYVHVNLSVYRSQGLCLVYLVVIVVYVSCSRLKFKMF